MTRLSRAIAFSFAGVLFLLARVASATVDDGLSPVGETSTPDPDPSEPAPIPRTEEPALELAPARGEPPVLRSPGVPMPKVPSSHRRKDDESIDYDTHRYEPAAFPLIGGDSDIGFEFGAVGTLTRFGSGVRPYLWNMDLVLSASLKAGPTGRTDIAQQLYLWNFDVPNAFDTGIRLNPTVMYERTVNQAYFGLGNASSPDKPGAIPGEPGRYYQFDDRQAMVRELTRFKIRGPWDGMIATQYRFEAPSSYEGSRLESDVQSSAVIGYRNMSVVTVGAGVVYDTRDNEFFPHRGSYDQIGIRYAQGIPFDSAVRYGAFGAMLAKYVPVVGPLVLAMRGVVDAEVGNVPFYDLYTGGPFQTYEMIGGSSSVRGVPDGRYSGPLKIYGNVEARAMLVDFTVLKQRFHLGGNVLFDAGRLWSDYTFTAKTDGKGLGVKWGTGVGAYLIWGQAAVFRAEFAYSPDAVSENPSLPIGIYVEDGVMF